MKYELLIKILFYVLSAGRVTTKELADKYEISPRTVLRYMDTLSLAGIPVMSIRGRNGGFKLMDTYVLPVSFMTKEEFDVSLSALESICNQLGSQTLESAIRKLKSVNKKSEGTLNFKSGNLVIDEGEWGKVGSANEKLKLVENAIENKKVLSLDYHDRNGEKTVRLIEPYLVLFKQGVWYVYAYCRLRKDFRLFKVSRIAEASVTGETFDKKDFDATNLDFSLWFDNKDSEEVEFTVDKSARSDVEEWLGISSVSEDGKGVIYAKAKLPIEDSLVSKILSFCGEIKVEKPQSLKEKVKEKANLIYTSLA